MSDRQPLTLPGPIVLRVAFWLMLLLVFPVPVATAALSFRVEVLGCVTNPAIALPSESEPQQVPEESPAPLAVSERVLHHLEKAETKESDPWLRDDIRIAWITTLYAARGESDPHRWATLKVIGLHPEQVWDAIVERRKAQLGPEFALWYDEAGNAPPLKKPARSVRPEKFGQQNTAA